MNDTLLLLGILLFNAILTGKIIGWFLNYIRRLVNVSKPKGSSLPPLLTGIVERTFFTIITITNFNSAPAAMMTWLVVKMASNWNTNRQIQNKKPPYSRLTENDRKNLAMTALIGGLISMLFAYLGGMLYKFYCTR